MRRLAQSYSFSASQMDGLEKPVFPPPPGAIVPDRKDVVAEGEAWGPGGSGSGSTGGGGVGTTAYATTSPANTGDAGTGSAGSPALRAPVRSETPVDMEIDGVATLPQSSPTPTVTPPGLPIAGRTEAILPVGPMATPPAFGGTSNPVQGPVGAGKSATSGTRPPSLTSQSPLGGQASRLPRDGAITGGRPVVQSTGRPTGGLPRGTVVGGESTHAGRAPMGHGAGLGAASGQSGIVGGRRLAGETGGMVGGRPQQPGRTVGRPFTPGGTGLVRNSASSEGARGAAGAAGRGVSPQRPGESRRDGAERPDYLVEDEETWQQGGRRVVPPVID